MSQIKEKIAKLLALSASPNENEAQLALLNARKLMAKYKLQPEDILEHRSAKVVRELTGIRCTKMTNPWMVTLAAVIAPRYCCQHYISRVKGAKMSTVGFVGLEEDFAVCKRVYLYACGFVQARCTAIRSSRRDASGREIREMCNSYGLGFCQGLKKAFETQDERHQELALVLTVPGAVTDSIKDMRRDKPYVNTRSSGWKQKYADAGFADGKRFDPSGGGALTGQKALRGRSA